jgi:short-subunit dehydrogenase involved in D-alanine esterification of teichoic acids
VAEEFAGTNILVNNAGIGRALDFRSGEISLAGLEQEIATNLTGTVWVTSQFLPVLLPKGAAAVVTISSALAIAPSPTLPVYSATKAAVHAFSSALRYQLRDTPVRVFDVLPTWVDTGLTDHLTADKVSPDVVAQAILDGLRTDTHEIYVGRAKALRRINRISPALAQRLTINSLRPNPTPLKPAAGNVQMQGNGGKT